MSTTESLRPTLFSLAYRMVGSVADAEDIVQEALLRHHRAESATTINSDIAFLTTVTTRLAIDHLRLARSRREAYVGPWLPEPVLADEQANVPGQAETADSLSLAFLVLLESLTPVERAVFLLHDVFDYGYDEVAAIVGKTEANCRQLAVRARRRVEEQAPRFDASREERDRLAERFFAACGDGDVDGLVELLADEAILYGDGGGKAPAVPRPVEGALQVARVLVGIARQAARAGLRARRTTVNGQPGAVFVDDGGRIAYVMAIDVVDGAVRAVRSIVNPEKLRHLGPLVDFGEMAARLRDPR